MLVDDSTFWAGSWPHARNMAVTTLDACALKPPSESVEGDYDLRFAVTMPSVACGTVGGGTSLPAQKACLGLLGVAGATDADAAPGTNAQQLSRIIASTVLCGELSLLAALSSNHLISAHLALNRKPSK